MHGILIVFVWASATAQKKIVDEKLVLLVQSIHPHLAGEIPGILLEINDTESLYLLKYLESLHAKIDEAIFSL